MNVILGADHGGFQLKEEIKDWLILFCRNGFGMCIVANRFAGVRCGVAFDEEAVRRGRVDDDINCLSIPADYVESGDVKKMIETFLKTDFSGKDRYKRRIVKIDNLII